MKLSHIVLSCILAVLFSVSPVFSAGTAEYNNATASLLPADAVVTRAGVPLTPQLRTGESIAEPVEVRIPLTPNTRLDIRGRLGKPQSRLTLHSVCAPSLSLIARDDAPGKSPVAYASNAVIGVDVDNLFSDLYYVRPKPWDRKNILAEGSNMSATAHTFIIRIDYATNTCVFWLDDRCLGAAAVTSAVSYATLALNSGNALDAVTRHPLEQHGLYLPVALDGYAHPGSFATGVVAGVTGRTELDGIPFDAVAPTNSIDLAAAKWSAKGNDFTDYYFCRSAFDRDPDSVIVSVPRGDYAYAHILCAVDDDPAESPVVSVRLTRFLDDQMCSGRGDGVADSSVLLPVGEGPLPEGCRKVGEIRTGSGIRPLLLVSMPLKSGEITDVLDEQGFVQGRGTGYLELDFTKELRPVMTLNYSNFGIKPVGKQSAVHILGLTLERCPLKIRVGSTQVGNVFYRTERPGLQVKIANPQAQAFPVTVAGSVADYYGRSQAVKTAWTVLAGHGLDEGHYALDLGLDNATNGWFAIDLRFLDAKGRLIWRQPTTLAILPPDTRRAGIESPFGTWWFRERHIGTPDIKVAGPLMQRAGFRHTIPGTPYNKFAPLESEMARYGLTLYMLPWVEKLENARQELPVWVKQHPSVKWAMIFHESAWGETTTFPPEFVGQPTPKLSAEQEKQFQNWWDEAIRISRFYREKYPDIKLIFGNGSLPFMVEFLRRGYPKELIDAIGDEDTGQSRIPEGPPSAFKSMYWSKRYAERYGYNVPVTACLEWRTRDTHPGNLTEAEQAAFYTRDCLGAMAFRAPFIAIAAVHDMGTSYYYSRWGAGGLCRRFPLLNPKPSYVALATLTRTLDCAAFVRFVNTPSPSLYVAEFKRRDKSLYALWLPRGTREVDLHFAGNEPCLRYDMLGNAARLTPHDGTVRVAVSGEPCYLECATSIVSVTVGPTVLPDRPAADSRILSPMNNLAAWDISSAQDVYLEKPFETYPRCPALARADVVADDGGRSVIRLAPVTQTNVTESYARYVALVPKEPIPIQGVPRRLGIWVKGNSSWGRVRWEYTDSTGRRCYSVGTDCGEWDLYDWKGATFINFDGWNYLSIELPARYACGTVTPARCNWRVIPPENDPEPPFRFTRLVVELRDRAFRIVEWQDVPNPAICLRDLTAEY